MFNLNSIEYTTKTRYSMFKLINFYFFGKIIINLEFDGCNTFQRSWDRWPKSLRKLRNAHQTPVWIIPTGEQANWEQVGAMSGYKLISQTFTSKDGARFTTLWTTAGENRRTV